MLFNSCQDDWIIRLIEEKAAAPVPQRSTNTHTKDFKRRLRTMSNDNSNHHHQQQHRNHRRHQRITASFSSRQQLCGRDNELRILRSMLQQARKPTEKSSDIAAAAAAGEDDNDDDDDKGEQQQQREQRNVPSIFVGGRSGMGKSALIHAAFASSQQQQACLFASGKFELGDHHHKPYGALTNAVNDLITGMMHDNRERYKTLLREGMDKAERCVLSTLIPSVAELMGEPVICSFKTKTQQQQQQQQGTNNNSNNMMEGLEQLKYAFRQFFGAISLPEKPVVLFLDDLQWMDPATWNLLTAVLSNSNLRHFVFVGAYRDDEVVDKQHLMNKCTATLLDPPPKKLHMANLTVQSLVSLLADILKVEDEDVKELADLIHSRTHGNVFHVLQLLDFMETEGLLAYSLQSFQWTWSMNKVRSRTSLSANVLEIVLSKLQRLAADERACLKLASCLGFRFDGAYLALVKDALPNKDEAVCTDLSACLTNMVEHGFLEALGHERFKFVHDKVHQAVLQLFESQEELMCTRYEIGRSLWQSHGYDVTVPEQVEDRLLFLMVDQIGAGRQLIQGECLIKLAELNLVAATRAAQLVAFVPAVSYVEMGIELLQRDTAADTNSKEESAGTVAASSSHWLSHYQLSLELFTMLAEMMLCIGRFEKLFDVIDQVCQNAKSIDDSFRVYMVKFQYYLARGNYGNVTSTGFHILQELGEGMPKKSTVCDGKRVVSQYKERLRFLSDDDILSLPPMISRRKARALRVLCDIVYPVEMDPDVKCPEFGGYIASKLVNMMLDEGLAPYSGVAFGAVGLHLVVTGNLDEGYRMARIARALAKREETENVCRTLNNTNLYRHWREPLANLVDSAIESHRTGMRMGNVTNAFESIISYSMFFYYAGLPLGPLVADIKNYCQLAVDYGQTAAVMHLATFYQLVLNLTGESDSVLSISDGSTAKMYRNMLGWDGKIGQETEWSFQMQLAFYCDEIDLALEMAQKLQENEGVFGRGLIFYQVRVFFFALIAIRKARDSRKVSLRREYWRKQAKKHFERVHLWVVDKKSLNMAHKLLILEAEIMTLDKKKRRQAKQDHGAELKSAYDKAIAASIRAGFLQDGALTARLASITVPDPKERDAYFERARELYHSWGAKGIEDYIVNKRVQELGNNSSSSSLVLGGDQESSESGSSFTTSPGGYRSRSRFDPRLDKSAVDVSQALELPEDEDDDFLDSEDNAARNNSSISSLQGPNAYKTSFLSY